MEDSAQQYDAIVIGSGIGGLTTAGLLAGVAGKAVLVLEKHTEPGGLTHVFRRDGACWDVGLHYVGEVGPGSQPRALFDYLSGGALRWNRMPERFERFIYPELEFAVPSDPAAYERALCDAFADEAPALRRYFADVRRAANWARLGFVRAMVPRPLEPLLRLWQGLSGGLATRTTGEVLAARFRSPALRALLASQWGDYGLPPARSAFAIHAQVVGHYLHGAWFPEGGAGRIARTFEPGIERAGGAIRVGMDVQGIVVEGGRAIGVRVLDRRGPEPVARTFRAPVVVSGIGAQATFTRLLPTDGSVGAMTAGLRARLQRLRGGLSAVTLYLRLAADPRSLGVQGENYWIHAGYDHDDIAGQTRALVGGRPSSLYVSFPSVKSGDSLAHTAEIIAFVDDGVFAPWRDQVTGARDAGYAALKQRIADGMLERADAHIRGLAALVSYAELSTPLTVEHYTGHPDGHFYGLPATPERYRGSRLPGPRTPIQGLYLTGSDAGCLGIVGAMMGGVGAACQVLGGSAFPRIRSALRAGPAPAAGGALPAGKSRARLVARSALTPSIWQLDFDLDAAPPVWAPGQFARLRVGDAQWRDYSIAGCDAGRLRLLVSTRTGGHGSRYAQSAAVGMSTEIELPLGRYRLSGSDRRQVFVATGTGLAPLLPMFASLRLRGRLADAVLLYGCRTLADDITTRFEPLPGRVVRCLSRDAAPAGGYAGRVSAALDGFAFDPEATDFYLCGSSAMVADCRALLQQRGAHHLFTELF